MGRMAEKPLTAGAGGLRPGHLGPLGRRPGQGPRHRRHLQTPGQPALRGDRRRGLRGVKRVVSDAHEAAVAEIFNATWHRCRLISPATRSPTPARAGVGSSRPSSRPGSPWRERHGVGHRLRPLRVGKTRKPIDEMDRRQQAAEGRPNTRPRPTGAASPTSLGRARVSSRVD